MLLDRDMCPVHASVNYDRICDEKVLASPLIGDVVAMQRILASMGDELACNFMVVV